MSDDRTNSDPDAVRVSGLRVRFGRNVVLDGLDLALGAGTTTALLGPNGAGKSTLLRVLLGVVKPRAGEVRVLGLDPLRRAACARERIGYVPDVPDAPPWMTARDLFRFLAPHHPTWDEGEGRAQLERLHVPGDVPLGAMSRGQGMKLLLAASLAQRPALLLLDEPFAGLDPLIREEVLRSVIGALDGSGRTVLVATHDLDVAARVADRVAVLAHGRIRREGTLDEIGARIEPAPAAARLHQALASAVEAE